MSAVNSSSKRLGIKPAPSKTKQVAVVPAALRKPTKAAKPAATSDPRFAFDSRFSAMSGAFEKTKSTGARGGAAAAMQDDDEEDDEIVFDEDDDVTSLPAVGSDDDDDEDSEEAEEGEAPRSAKPARKPAAAAGPLALKVGPAQKVAPTLSAASSVKGAKPTASAAAARSPTAAAAAPTPASKRLVSALDLLPVADLPAVAAALASAAVAASASSSKKQSEGKTPAPASGGPKGGKPASAVVDDRFRMDDSDMDEEDDANDEDEDELDFGSGEEDEDGEGLAFDEDGDGEEGEEEEKVDGKGREEAKWAASAAAAPGGIGKKRRGPLDAAADEDGFADVSSAAKQHDLYTEKLRQRGVCYLPSIPPMLRPSRLRDLLTPYGTILRIYLAPEDESVTRRRKKIGSGGGRRFVNGWVEFQDKRKAKRAALLLHNTPIGGSKRSKIHYDLWNIKYLSGFKWSDLAERKDHEKRMRETVLREELGEARRETTFYLDQVAQAKKINAIEAKAEGRKRKTLGGDGRAGAERGEDDGKRRKVQRTFHQRSVISNGTFIA